MILYKKDLGNNSTHYVKIGLHTFTPDTFIKIKDNLTVDFTITDSDCIFFIVDPFTISLKPIGTKYIDSLSYEDLKSITFGKFTPEYVYTFSKGSIDIERFKDKYLS